MNKNNFRKSILVLGAGVWGSTIASLLSEKGYKVILWDRNKEKVDYMNRNRKHPKIELNINNNLEVVNEIPNINFNYIIIAVTVQAIKEVIIKFKGILIKDSIIINLSKGIENITLKRPSEIIKEVLNKDSVALYGPSFAIEVINKNITNLAAISKDTTAAEKVKEVIENKYLKVIIENDIIGYEISSALKNCIALAYGIAEGLELGINTKSLIIFKGLEEIINLGLKLGAKRDTFIKLPIADLFATCINKNSRNKFLGEQIGKGEKVDEILNNMETVAEGYETVKAAYNLSKRNNIKMELIESLYFILYEKASANSILSFI